MISRLGRDQVAGVALASIVALLIAGAGARAQTVLRCQGDMFVKIDGGEPSSRPQSRYFKIASGSFQSWDAMNGRWEDNLCAMSFWTCTLNRYSYAAVSTYADGAGEQLNQSISINRKAGRLTEMVLNKFLYLHLDAACAPAPDPAASPKIAR